MKILFLLLIMLHGLIHLLGFVKGFGYNKVTALTFPISKLMGSLWLLTTVLFLIYGLLYYTHHPYDWLIGIIAVTLSQILILILWKDAKFGTILNLIVLIVSIVSLGSYLIKNEFANQVKNNFSENNSYSTAILTEKDIAHLPPMLQKYLHYTKSVGKPKVKNFRAEFEGGMREKPEDAYMQFHSVQYNFYENPSRYFYMEAHKTGVPATGLHTFQNKIATFNVKLLNWLNIIDAKGDKLNQAETVTLFNDMCLIAPATLIGSSITWEVINNNTLRGIFKNGDICISAVLYFNEQGKLLNFISNDRYHTDGTQYHNYPWETPVYGYKMVNGYFLPSKAKLIYQKPDGNFTYGELEYKNVQYNLFQYIN